MANSAFTLSSNIGSDGKSNRATKYQVSHGFSAGSVIRYVQETNGVTGAFLLAQATSGISAEAIGIVESVDSVGNEFTVVYSGEIDTSNFITVNGDGVTGHDVWFLDATVAGGLTSHAPTSAGQVVKPVLTNISGSQDNRGLVTNYIGTVIGGDNTVSLDSVHPVGEIIAFAGNTSDIPTGWQLCDGSTLDISGDYATYYSRVGEKYGYQWECQFTHQGSTGFAADGGQTMSMQVGGNVYQGRVVSYTASAGTTGTVLIDAMPFTGAGLSGGESSAGGVMYYHGVTFDNSNMTFNIGGSGVTNNFAQYASSNVVKYVKTPDLRSRTIIGASAEGITAHWLLSQGLDGITQGAFGGAEDADVTESSDSGSGLHVYTAQSATNANLRQPFLAEHYIIRTTSTAKAALVDAVNVDLAIDGLTDVTATGQADGDFLVRTGDSTPVYKPIKLFNNYPSDPSNFENAFQIHTDTNRLAIGHNSPAHEIDVKSALNPEIRITDTTNNNGLRLYANDTGSVVKGHESSLWLGSDAGWMMVMGHPVANDVNFRASRVTFGHDADCDVGISGDIGVSGDGIFEGQVRSTLETVSPDSTWAPNFNNGNVQLWQSGNYTHLELKNSTGQEYGGQYTLVIKNTSGDPLTLNITGSYYAFANGIAPNIVRPQDTMVISMVTATGKLLCTWAEGYA